MKKGTERLAAVTNMRETAFAWHRETGEPLHAGVMWMSQQSQPIVQRWRDIQEDKLFPFLKKVNKPLLFLEIGWLSQDNVAYEPWDYTRDQPINLELQRKLYEGFFRAWWGNPLLGGFSIWEWTPGEGGPEDGGYTPENKPAEHVARAWLAKPRWVVK